MHGGAVGSGAPIGNQNARKHGNYSREALATRQRLRQLLSRSRDHLDES
jgi:uncharacterized protein YjcR